MRSTLVVLALGLAIPIVAVAGAEQPADGRSAPEKVAAPAPAPHAEPEFQLEPYQLVMLQRPASPREYPPEKLEEIQTAHLAHLTAMAKAGKMVVAGPFGDQPDEKLRGLCLYRVGSLDEARRLAEEDPAVKAGRLEVVVWTWYTEKGALAFPIAEKLAAGGR
jgi:uncharacterized protein